MPRTARRPSGTFRLSCLGPGQLLAPDGRRIPLRTRKHLALLLLLGMRPGRAISRDRLIELLWSEDGERAARHSLSQSVSLVNKAVGEDLIAAHGASQLVVAEGALETDVAAFETLVREGRHDEARALWHGTLLDGFWLRRAPAFERWLADERGRLERLMRRMSAELVERCRQDGDHVGMRAEAEALLALDPLDEGAMLACLQALTLAGERTLALRRFSEFERRLKAELDAEPGSALRTWARRHRKSEPEVPRTSVVGRVHDVQALPAAQPLFGRVEEYRQLWDAWERATAGTGSFWIIEGEPGIGKTALVGKLANQVHVSGASVCFVKCYATEKAVPFAPISALIRQLARLPGFVATSPSWIGELTRLVPELKDRFPNAPAPMGVDDSARFRLCDATVQAAESVADEQPLLIVVDDIHDADEVTLALLHYLGRQVPGWPAMVVATSRLGIQSTGVERAFFQTTRATGQARFVRLTALDADCIAKLVAQVAASVGVENPGKAVDAIVANANGNPLVATEAAYRTSHEGMEAHSLASYFDALLVERLRLLSPNAQLVAAAFALVGRPLAMLGIAEITDLPTATLVASIEELEAAGLVQMIGTAYGLAHQRYQVGIDQSTPATVRAIMHARIAMLKSMPGAAKLNAGIEVARHFALAGRNRRATRHALAAARYARSLGAVRERATALELATALSGRHANQLLELAECYLDLKEFDLVAALVNEIETARPGARSVHLHEAAYFRVISSHQAGDMSFGQVRTALEDLLASQLEFPHRIPALFQLVRATDKGGDPRAARRYAKALRQATRDSRSVSSSGYRALVTGYVICRFGNPARAIPPLEAGLRHAHQISDWELELICRDGLGAALKQVGRFTESIDQIRVGLEFARKTLNPQAESVGLNNLAVSEIALGRLLDAEDHLRQSARIDAGFPKWPFRAYRMLNEGALHYHLGRLDASQACLRAALDFAGRHQLWAVELAARGMLAMCAVRTGDHAALAVLSERLLLELQSRRHLVPDRGPTETALAWSEVLSGEVVAAHSRLDQACRFLRRRDVDHWLFVELERIRVREFCDGRPRWEERRGFYDTAMSFNAIAFANAANDA